MWPDASHTARSRNDIDMTMYRMRIRAGCSTSLTPPSRCGGRWPTSRPASRRSFRRTRTRNRRSRCVAHYLLRRSGSSSAIPAALRGVPDNEPQSARCVPSPGRVSDRSRAHVGAARLRRTHRQHVRQHRDRGLRPRKRGRGTIRARRRRTPGQDLLLWCTTEWAICACRTTSCR